MTETKPKRHLFRFSLRTLFVFVTGVALFLGWRAYCLDWIRQRHDWIDSPTPKYVHCNGNSRPPPWYLRLFGEQQGWEAISMRFVPWTEPEPDVTDEQHVYYDRIQRLFPEAIISTSPLDGRRPKNLRVIN